MIGYIYVIYCEGEICYVGRTVNMKTRWRKYKSCHQNQDPKNKDYDMQIHKYMREKGFDKFEHEIVESYEVEKEVDLNYYEGIWQRTFTELGFDLKNKYGAGNGDNVKGTRGYENDLARKREKVTCELCGASVRRDGIRKHQRTMKCINHSSAAKRDSLSSAT